MEMTRKQMIRPKVSVIMNCLNCGDYLPEALQSLKKQTFQDFEIIFWDNASVDCSASLAKNYGSALKYFRGEKTVPLGTARNLAIARASGTFIAFLDCDDLWKPEKLAQQVRLMDSNPDLGLVCTDTEILNGKKIVSRVFARTKPARGMVFTELMTRQWISMSSAMLRKTALDNLPGSEKGKWFDENLNVCEEADVFYRMAHDYEIDYIDEPLTIWRIGTINTTLNKFGQFAGETLAILDKHRHLYPDYDASYPDLVEILSRRAAFQSAVALWKDGNNGEARKTLKPWLNTSLKYRVFWIASFLPGSLFNFLARIYFALPKSLLR